MNLCYILIVDKCWTDNILSKIVNTIAFIIEFLFMWFTNSKWWSDNIVAIVGTVLAFGAFIYTRMQFHHAEKQTRESEISNAWGILARQGGGNMGKKEALETLARHGIPLVGIDVSSPDPKNPTWLVGLDLSTKMHEHQVKLMETNFNNCRLDGANFSGAYLHRVQFHNTILEQAKFHTSELRLTQFHSAHLASAEFNNAYLDHTTYYRADLRNTKFNGAMLYKVHFIDPTQPEDCTKYAKCFASVCHHTKNCWTSGGLGITQQGIEGIPYVPPHFEVIVTDRPHKNQEGEVDGYYIEIKPKENKTS